MVEKFVPKDLNITENAVLKVKKEATKLLKPGLLLNQYHQDNL